MQMQYIVMGRTAEGETLYYTGKAGKEFVSASLHDAFSYYSIEGARRRATTLNQGTDMHGIRFFAPCGERVA
jgi:hypothetical protein